MCGIAGILRTWQPGDTPPPHFDAIPEAWLDILDDSIKHRGPDGKGRFRHRVTRPDGTIVDVALVHRRLSIIDHADGAQPMVIGSATENACTPHETPSPGLQSGVHPPSITSATTTPPTKVGGSEHHPLLSREGSPYTPLPTATDHHTCPKCGPGVLAVVFNGCIYNHRELRQELENAGHEFFSDHSDTEVLLHGWREWGKDLPEHLDSMHAFAIWDAALGRVYLSRDDFGEKPLSVGTSDADQTLVLSSNALGAAMVLSHESTPHLDLEWTVEWIRLGYDAELSPFQRIHQVGHGDLLSADELLAHAAPLRRERKHAHHPSLRRRFRRSLPRIGGTQSAAEQVDRSLARAVASRLEADVPLGCLLSGGVDSSLITHYANTQLEKQLTTICVRMPDDRYDESPYAQIAADHIGTKHIVVDADPNPAEDLQLLIHSLGLPFGDSSLLPTWWACRAAASEVKVLLSGDGGDELFLGYQRYKALRTAAGIAEFDLLGLPLSLLARALPRKHPKSRTDKLARLLLASAAGPEQVYRELLAVYPMHDLHPLLAEPYNPKPLIDSTVDDPIKARDYDLLNHLPGDMLRKVDTASMLAGVEVRAPFLEREVARTAIGLPLDLLMPWGQRKGLLRAVARKYLPAEIVDRPKMGFAIPIGEWFRSDYGNMRQLLYDHLGSADPFPGLAESGVEINMGFVQQMLREHDAAGERSINPWHGRDHSQRLYMLVVLSIWCRWLTSL